MKIGIITFWDSEDNYGQLMQCYASQHYLQSIGHEAFLIRYKHTSEYIPDRSLLTIIKKVINPLIIYRKLNQIFMNKKKAFINNHILNHNVNRDFESFRKEHIKSTDIIYNQFDLKRNPPICEILMCGSDQIWASVPIDPIYFLDFGNNSQKRVSLGASFGRKDFPETSLKELKERLNKLDVITVREKDAISICEQAGRFDSKMICDPTMLNDVSHYDAIAEGIDANNKVFLYYLGHKTKVSVKKIIHFLEKEDYLYCASQGAVNILPKVFPSIPKWLGDIKSARFIITNSFHGTVFSILFEKQFAVIPLENVGANDRIETLLDQIGLSSRICSNLDDLSLVMNERINYETIKPKIEKIRTLGQSVILEILNQIKITK